MNTNPQAPGKRIMSQEQLDRLKIARELALKKRKENCLIRKENKEMLALANIAAKEQAKVVKQKKVKELASQIVSANQDMALIDNPVPMPKVDPSIFDFPSDDENTEVETEVVKVKKVAPKKKKKKIVYEVESSDSESDCEVEYRRRSRPRRRHDYHEPPIPTQPIPIPVPVIDQEAEHNRIIHDHLNKQMTNSIRKLMPWYGMPNNGMPNNGA